jgi:hypothetical protein
VADVPPPPRADSPTRGEDDIARIDSDAPTEDDELGRHRLVTTLTSIVRSAQTPLVIAIYGAWGTGKTSLLRQLRRELDPRWDGTQQGEQTTKTVWFDPWMHQFDDSPALGLLHAAVDQLGVRDQRNVRAALSSLAIAMGEDIQIPFIGVRVGKLLRVREELARDDFNRREERARLKQHFHDVLRSTGARDDRRVVFFIDDLDRCRPGVALGLLEALKLYMDMPGCVYVLGIDRQPLEAAVDSEYGSLGLRAESYLDKIIQLPFALPSIDPGLMRTFVARRLPRSLAACVEMLVAAAADEPRSVKRITNSLLVNHELAHESPAFEAGDYDPRILAALVLFQNLAPETYRQIRAEPRLINLIFRSRDEATQSEGEDRERTLWEELVAPTPRLEAALRTLDVDDELDLVPYLTLADVGPSAVHVSDEVAGARDASVYISYRPKDSAGAARAIADGLSDLGWTVRMDVSIPSGADVRDFPRRSVEEADVVLVIIGRNWLDVGAGYDTPRLADAVDRVRVELEAALSSDKLVIPVLVDGATMPSPSELPAAVSELAYRNGVTVPSDYFAEAVARLDVRMREAMGRPAAA